MFWQRKYPRLSKKFQIDYQPIDPEHFTKNPISSFALNISGGGICFEAHAPLHPGAMVALAIHSTDFPRLIRALVKVAWCTQTGDTYTIGAEFWWLGWDDPVAQNAIADYVARQMPETPAS